MDSQAPYRVGEYALGMAVAATVATVVTACLATVPPWPETCGFALASVLLGSRTIRLSWELGTVSLGFMFVFAAIVELGPMGGMIAGAASALGGTLFVPNSGFRIRRVPAVVLLAAAGNITLAAVAAGWTLAALNAVYAGIELTYGLLPPLLAASVYYVINSFGVALLASASNGRSALRIWSEGVAWTSMPFALGWAAVVAVHLAAHAIGPWIWFAVIPIAAVIHVTMELRARARVRRAADEPAVAP